MRNAVAGFAAGIAAGFLVAYLLFGSGVAPETSPLSINESLNAAMERLNEMIQMSYPDVSVRATKVVPYGKFYLVTVEFYNQNGTLATEQMFMPENGSFAIVNNERCVLKLKEERVKVSEDDDPYVGSKDAKVVIVEFSDYTCPFCARFALDVEKKIIEKYGDKVRIVFRDFPLHGNISFIGAEAANCAGEQGKYWDFHYLLFEKQSEWVRNTTKLYDYAEALGLNVTAFRQCLESGKYRSEVEKDLEDGKKYGVTGTPTFFINGKKVVGYISFEVMSKLIEKELAGN